MNAHPCLTARGRDSIRVAVTVGGQRKSHTLRGDFSDEHVRRALRMRESMREAMSRGHDEVRENRHYKMGDAYKQMFLSARKRREYALSRDDERLLMDESEGRCALTGLAFDLEKGGWARRPYAPSLDRIDSSKGYTFDNCRIVCVAVNVAMNEWGESVFRRVALAYLSHSE